MTRLILLNGPPASGKSTLATLFAASHPLTLNLDIDIVRSMLGGWADQSTDAGLLARELAIGMARTVLTAGRDVIVPQFLARREFVDQLEQSVAATHQDAQQLIDRLGGYAALDQMYGRFVQLVHSRPATRTIPARDGNVHRTLRELERVLADEASE